MSRYGQKFVMTEQFTMENFKKWITSFVDGELEPYFRSADAPDPEVLNNTFIMMRHQIMT